MATTILNQENSFDVRLAALLTTGTSLSRINFAVQMAQLTQDLTLWRNEAQLLKSPVLSPSLNVTLANDTLARVSDYDTVLSYLAQALSLTGPATAPGSPSLGAAQLSLSATAASWGADRHLLASAPGNVTLTALTHISAALDIPQYVVNLSSAPNLAPSRAIVISAIQVQPAPFPAAAQTLALAPTTSMQVQVAVSNLREILQPVTLTMVLTPLNRPAQTITLTQTLSPTSSFAFAMQTFTVFPGEKGTLSVTLNGVPAGSTLSHNRTYALSVAPLITG